MFKPFAAFAFAASIIAAPAAAVTYDAFASFDGVNNPAGQFAFGQTDGVTFTPFTEFSNCITGIVCLNGTTEPSLGVYKNITGSAFTFDTIDVPAASLILHPGPTLQSYIKFTAPASRVYSLAYHAKLISNSTITGVTLYGYSEVGGVVSPAGLLSLNSGFPEFSAAVPFFIAAGDSLYIAVDPAGNYQFDSTQIDFTLSAVPEPATWTLMIAGFGLAGVAMRRRVRLAA